MIWLASGIPAPSYSLGRIAQIVPRPRVRPPRRVRFNVSKPFTNARLRPFIGCFPAEFRRRRARGDRADTSYNRPRVTVPMNDPPDGPRDGPPDGRVLRLLDRKSVV